MSIADSKYIKSMNRKILIETILENGSISRSELARKTGLNKSTVSDQISGLIEENLLIEEEATSSTGGRKPINLHINKNAGYSIGIDFDEPILFIQVTDLLGNSIESRSLELENLSFQKVIELLIEELANIRHSFNSNYKPFGLVGIGVGIHGIVRKDEHVVFTPKLQWTDIDIKSSLEETFNVPVFIDNNANLCAYAEQVFNYSIEDLFCVTMYSGIGLGIIKDRQIYRGYQGFAGEIGHMIVERDGKLCPCGNRGCWERYASEKAVFDEFKSQQIITDSINIKEMLLNKQHMDIFESFYDYLAIGLNNIINIFNPETIILNGDILNKNPHIIKEIEDRLKSRMNNYSQIVPSCLGKNAGALGGSVVSLREFYGVNRINLTTNKNEVI
ncbi:ROK family transcriptional regulator [Halobacillus sp. Nhm2S1]|uniref:ROK family transcriptional regulator n=1 Tax=Halobacillus sp. Nhm2S1 TaxID=2866716 RepID=UPI001C72DF6B|nr:ROK family transcriptional regulator [Halobacillus sp. Nhm2S1]MBX0356845.1 ROK family transcriptional regulator [Halobacillus sp. Nhm2S1]